MKNKAKYRVRNWSDYNRSLRNRGSLTFWISAELTDHWLEAEKSAGGRGRRVRYSAQAIVAMAQLKLVFRQAGRQTCGLLASVFRLLKVALPVPDHSTLSRRLSGVEVGLPVLPKAARHLVMDSTGLKVYGEGEWKVRAHGASKRRTWRKLHLCVDEATGEVIACAATENSVSDCAMFPHLLEAVAGEITQVSADGSYDRKKVYEALNHRGIRRAAIPPRRNAKIRQHGNAKKERLIRDENLRSIRAKGRAKWKREAAYHRRSLAETGVFRFKQIFTDQLQSRSQENQFQEIIIKCAALNRMTHLGMPDSYKVAV